MKEIIPSLDPAPPAMVQNAQEQVRGLFSKYVVPSYGRFDLALERGEGSWLWDVSGRRLLDLGGGIAVCSLGHANAEITSALVEQSRRLVHVSNLYYHEPQGRLAQKLCSLIGPGRVFFCNSGAEANEGLYKTARKFGHAVGGNGRYEIITALNSFHGRTLAGIAATGQEKVKAGFEPAVPGFRHVPFNDLPAVRAAITPQTIAVLIEGIQGEGGITSAEPEYLLGLRALCDERGLLLLMDSVQCGHFRSGRFQSYQRILEGVPGGESFLPDGISMAKSLGGGFPIGAFWLREPHGDLLSTGTHGTTYGGNPLGCAVASKIIEVIERDHLAEHARELGGWMKTQLSALAGEFPQVITAVRGLGFMLGFELAETVPGLDASKAASLQFVTRLHERGVLTIPSGTRVVRLLPALNLGRREAEHGLAEIARLVRELAG